MKGDAMPGRVIDKIGISEKRHDEIIKRFSEILPQDKPFDSTSDLIKIIANEPSFTREELVYLGLLLSATYERDEFV